MLKKNYDNSCDTGQTLIAVEKAQALLSDKVDSVIELEECDLKNALCRVIAVDISSSINVPPADNSAMDGYAVNTADLSSSGSSKLKVSQRICAGGVGETLEPGTAARIFTGAPIPKGANAVVMQEQCQQDGDQVVIKAVLTDSENIRQAGEDICEGDVILTAGQKLRAQDIGLAASVGVAKLSVYRRLRVAVFFTGDELTEPGDDLVPGQIYNSNRYTLSGLLKQLNCDVIDLGIVEDTLDATKAAMTEAAQQADLLMTSGGVSVGEEDHIRRALEELGQLDMWRLNIKPGKPLAYGQIKTENATMPFLGLPGNPVSVFATFCIVARPYILKMQGIHNIQARTYMIVSGFEWGSRGARQEYVRVRVEIDGSGDQQLTVYENQSSGVLTSASWANGFAIIPANQRVQSGDMIEFISFAEMSLE